MCVSLINNLFCVCVCVSGCVRLCIYAYLQIMQSVRQYAWRITYRRTPPAGRVTQALMHARISAGEPGVIGKNNSLDGVGLICRYTHSLAGRVRHTPKQRASEREHDTQQRPGEPSLSICRLSITRQICDLKENTPGDEKTQSKKYIKSADRRSKGSSQEILPHQVQVSSTTNPLKYGSIVWKPELYEASMRFFRSSSEIAPAHI